MEYEEKMAVCKRRLDGDSIYQIAEALSVLPQSVNIFLQSLPQPDEPNNRRPDMTDREMLDICDSFLKGRTLHSIAEGKKCSENDICNVFAFIKARKPPKIESEYYPAVARWMQDNAQSLRTFSSAIGFSSPRLSNVLQGKEGAQMTFDMASAISEYTGLTFKEIYAVQLKASPLPAAGSAAGKRKE